MYEKKEEEEEGDANDDDDDNENIPNSNGKKGIRHLKIKFMMGWSVEIETDI